jgi:hypothetical protein
LGSNLYPLHLLNGDGRLFGLFGRLGLLGLLGCLEVHSSLEPRNNQSSKLKRQRHFWHGSGWAGHTDGHGFSKSKLSLARFLRSLKRAEGAERGGVFFFIAVERDRNEKQVRPAAFSSQFCLFG